MFIHFLVLILYRSVVFQDQEVVDFDAAYGEQEPDIAGETYVSFGNDAVSDQQTETDVKELEGKHKMSLQQMKEQVLGSVSSVALLLILFFKETCRWTLIIILNQVFL